MTAPTQSSANQGLRAFLSSRSCLVAAIAFGVAAIAAFPAAMALSGYALAWAMMRGALRFWLAMAVVPVVALGVPTLVAVLAARAAARFEKGAGRSDARLGVNLIAWSAAGLAGPLTIIAMQLIIGPRDERRAAAQRRFDARPIVASDSLGFCAPPVYGSEGGQPTVRLTARVPRTGRYWFRIAANDQADHGLFAQVDTMLDVGVHTVPLELRITDLAPGDPLEPAWPVLVTELAVDDTGPSAWQSTSWGDIRSGDSLAVLDSTGMR